MAESNRLYETVSKAGDVIAAVTALAVSKVSAESSAQVYRRLRPYGSAEIYAKAAAPALSTSDNPPGPVAGTEAITASYRRRSVLGRANGVRRVAPLTRQLPLTNGTTATFVSSTAAIPSAQIELGAATLLVPNQIGVITCFTKEAVEGGDPAVIDVISRDVGFDLAAAEDAALLDGAAAVAGHRPASILSGLSALGGGSPLTTEADVAELITTVRGGNARAPYFVYSTSGALYLAQLRGDGGERLFPDVNVVDGGSILGIPALISPAAEDKLVLFDADALLVHTGPLEIDTAEQAAVEMQTAPTGNAGSGTGASLISLWQTGVLGLRSVQYVTWALGTANGAAYAELPLGSPLV